MIEAIAKNPSGEAIRSTVLFCLSVRQPWAWLICNAGKDIENRTWPTTFRGPILIHAGKTMTHDDYSACCLFIASMRGRWRLPAYDILRRECGGIVGQSEIVDCISESRSEWFCGDYGFVLQNSTALPFVPCKGALGFFRDPRQNPLAEYLKGWRLRAGETSRGDRHPFR